MVERAMFSTPEDDPISIRRFKQGERPCIIFSDDDFAGIELPHNDALVVKAQIDVEQVSRVLIDPGSSTDVIYRGLYQRLKPHIKLEEINHPVYGFTGQPIWPLGVTVLNVKIGPKTVQVEFVVVDIETHTFNAILGRTWIGAMKAVPSTLHQKVKYMIPGGVVTVRGSQVESRVSFQSSIQFTLTDKQVNTEESLSERMPITADPMTGGDITSVDPEQASRKRKGKEIDTGSA